MGLDVTSLTPLRLLFELVMDVFVPIPNFFPDLRSQADFFNDDVIEATELDIFLFLEFEEVKPNFFVFSAY